MTFWTIRSRWDYFAFVAPVQWLCFGVGFASLAVGFETGIGVGLLAGIVLNTLSFVVVLSTWLGSHHHDHLSPSRWYHFGAIIFGPLVGLHYLHRTGREVEANAE